MEMVFAIRRTLEETNSGVFSLVIFVRVPARAYHFSLNRTSCCVTSRQILVEVVNCCLNASFVIFGNLWPVFYFELNKTESVFIIYGAKKDTNLAGKDIVGERRRTGLKDVFSVEMVFSIRRTLEETDSGVFSLVIFVRVPARAYHFSLNRTSCCMTSRQILVEVVNRCLNASFVIFGNLWPVFYFELNKTQSVFIIYGAKKNTNLAGKDIVGETSRR